MGLFDLFKKREPGTPWRNKEGELYCPGDDCPRKCDETCPIWCNTAALTYSQNNHSELAVGLFKKAIEIAPDYKEAWVNLAAVYGMQGNHIEAYKAYNAAYKIDGKYKNALYGLILSSANLGRLEEAMHYCLLYPQVGNPNEIKQIKEDIQAAIDKGKTTSRLTAMEMAIKIIAEARKNNILSPNDNFPHIPEIIIEAKRTCLVIFNEMIKLEAGRNPHVWLMWGVFAGIGAVHHWNIDWDSLKSKGIAETLLEPKGAFAMDEYVIDAIGLGWGTEKGEELNQSIAFISAWAMVEFIDKDENPANFRDIILELMQSMYIWGMVYEMERLGMR